ncbi:hypothetical protein MRS76_00900 [Rhizobiaceae bacterium n13]|uniref:Uncharacterized protein n=1 Tax=Ferirhizobium litorale TaxID=2927786 RepID=A0AAE3TZV6_9HYPH|nr:hypothetical protein [Fererhizobium litorale]MDI7860501.1 hypothetical protein [Fererhizobium litorale]MDI7920636.1 hypothetical protein [Fererhizobium litorale]
MNRHEPFGVSLLAISCLVCVTLLIAATSSLVMMRAYGPLVIASAAYPEQK